jgi:hypothetical protein
VSVVSTTYRVTTQDADGNFHVAEGVEDAPLKGDTFDYEHKEVRIGAVIRVEKLERHHDGTVDVSAVTEIGDTHHALERPEEGDELPAADEIAADPPDENNPPTSVTAAELPTAVPTGNPGY